MKERPSVIIVGGGAAGMMAAHSAVCAGAAVTLIERNEKMGRKLYITGKGRCNLTNNCTAETVLQNVPRNAKFLYSAMEQFPPDKTMEFFASQGLKLKTERGNRVFPCSDKAADVIDTLFFALKRERVHFVHGRVRDLMLSDGAVKGVVLENGTQLEADCVVLATGGCSYPLTGSSGDGYRLAESAGHTVIEPKASLIPLVEDGADCARMQGLALKNIEIKVRNQKKKVVFQEFGELLFTHFGLSGPLILSASAHMRNFEKERYTVSIDLKPALPPEKLYKRVSEDFALLANREAANCLVKLLPASMQPVMLDVWGMDPQRKVNQITREERRRLVELLKAFPVELAGKGDLAHAVVTSGGVSVKEVDPKTMQSKLCPGLYFAGEVLDVDAYTGGYNLGIAFATAYAAASHL